MNPDNSYLQTSDEVLKFLSSQREGLSSQEVIQRQKKHGLNQLTSKSKVSALSIFIEQFQNTLTLILIASAFLILFIYFFGGRDPSDLIEAGLILAIVLMIVSLGFFQEYKAEKAIESLKKMMAYKAKVKRDGREIEVDVKELVVGDIVILEEGTKVPADIQLIEEYSLSVSEASLTGESSPVSKNVEKISEQKQISDQKNMVFSGTSISSGRGFGVVVKTGDASEIGKIAQSVADNKEEDTPIQIRLDKIGKILGFGIIGICGLVFIFITFFAGDYNNLSLTERVIHSFVAAVALAVAAIPEGLPAVVTISLALGTQRMLKKNALVRKLSSVETLGSTDIICCDKTGTLTKGEMTVKEIHLLSKKFEVSGIGYDLEGKFDQDPKDLELILRCGLECNNATITDGKVLGDPTEAALIVSAAKLKLTSKMERVGEVPFSSERKMMSVVVKDGSNYLIFSKGAPEVIVSKSSNLTKKEQDLVQTQIKEMSDKALRTLGFAYKKISQKEFEDAKSNTSKLEFDLIFLGLQGMIDPPRVEVKPLIEQCTKSGIRVVMITGDHIDTAVAVAKEIGIKGDALSGSELDKLSEEEFDKIVENISIYARVNPNSKMRIVDSLKKKGHIVAMTGDGVNDAPALKKADIGIAMGITGTDVAKEASDIILLDDHFSTIVYAIEEGRGIFQNIQKFVNYLLSCNIGEVLVVFLAVFLFRELPLTATMLLWINVVTDGFPAVALGLDPTEKGVMNYSPKNFQQDIITKKMWAQMFIFGILLTIAVLGIYLFKLPEGAESAKGAAFSAIVVLELVRIYLIRSDFKTNLFSNLWLLLAVVGSLILQFLIIYSPLNKLFEISIINSFDWGLIVFAAIFLWIVFKIIERFLGLKHTKFEA